MSKHTQGPHVAKYNFHSSRQAPSINVYDQGGYLLAIVPRKGRKYEAARPQAEQEANADLFAAAPDMLAALQDAYERLTGNRDLIRAAIAKATGENI